MSPLPGSDLELKAARERERLHSSVLELRSYVRDSLDVTRRTREHLGVVCSLASLVGLAAGYAMAGIFVTDRKA